MKDLPQSCKKEDSLPTTIHFPDHDLVLPIRSAWLEDNQHPYNKPTFRFVTSMYFDEDKAIQNYNRKWNFDPSDLSRTDESGVRQVSIGFIYLTVHADLSRHFAFSNKATNMILLEFSSSSKEMNILFAESISIRKTFIKLLQRYHGMIGILDQRQKENHLFWFRGEELDYALKGKYFLPEEIERNITHDQ